MDSLTGCWKLVRFILRRDRYMILAWIVVLVLLSYVYAAAYKGLYPTAADRQSYFIGIAQNPALVAIFGKAYGSSLGALVVQRVSVFFVIDGIISSLFIIRNTRAEEESGRSEVVSATMVGRYAQLTSALIVVFGANVAIGLLTALGLMATGLPIVGSIAFGLSLAAAGCAFTAVAAMAAQLTESAGAARGISLGVLGVAFLLRAGGDAAGSHSSLGWLSWVSPLGWLERIQPFAGESWIIFLAIVAFMIVFVADAVALSAHRDVGGGIMPIRLGPSDARSGLNNIFALAFRLNRGQMIGWTFGFAMAGLILGGIAKSAGAALNDTGNAGIRDLVHRLGGGAGISDAYLTSIMGVFGLAAAGYTIQTILQLRVEEIQGRAEYLLATAQPRLRWALAYLSFALVSPAVALAAAGLTSGLAYGLSGHDVGYQIPRVMAAAVIQLPAVWVLTGIALALFGVVPRLASASWIALAVCLLVDQIGAALRLSQTVEDISPFTHIPKLPGGGVTALPLVALIAIGGVLSAIGLARLRTRDLGAA